MNGDNTFAPKRKSLTKCKPQTCILHAHNPGHGTFIPWAGGAALTHLGGGLVDVLGPLRGQANQVPMPKEVRGVLAERIMCCSPKSRFF